MCRARARLARAQRKRQRASAWRRRREEDRLEALGGMSDWVNERVSEMYSDVYDQTRSECTEMSLTCSTLSWSLCSVYNEHCWAESCTGGHV